MAVGDLQRVLRSAGEAARAARVPIVSGDTKVVDRGAADGLFVTTTGVGVRLPDAAPSATRGQPGDVVVLSGPIGLHGTAILSAREGLGFDSDIASDTQPLHWLVRRMVEVGGTDVHTLRDPTRGGVASVLNELAEAVDVGVVLDEAALPIPGNVRGLRGTGTRSAARGQRRRAAGVPGPRSGGRGGGRDAGGAGGRRYDHRRLGGCRRPRPGDHVYPARLPTHRGHVDRRATAADLLTAAERRLTDAAYLLVTRRR
ncbi:MAG: AIR synthase-related protein [Frankiaceae bacterium]